MEGSGLIPIHVLFFSPNLVAAVQSQYASVNYNHEHLAWSANVAGRAVSVSLHYVNCRNGTLENISVDGIPTEQRAYRR